jgi:hypothetical protein
MSLYKLIFTPEARGDVKEPAEYYDSQLNGLGKRFKKEVQNQLLLLKQNPFTRSVRYNDVRFALIDKFPYSIHYTIDNKKILIHAILSDYRDPARYWIY